MARRTIFGDTSLLEVVMASEADATEVLAGSDGTFEVAVIVVDEESFDLALARSSPDVAFAVVVVEDGFDLELTRLLLDVAFAVAVVDEDGFDLALVLRGVAASDDEASLARAGHGETSVLAGSDEASKV